MKNIEKLKQYENTTFKTVKEVEAFAKIWRAAVRGLASSLRTSVKMFHSKHFEYAATLNSAKGEIYITTNDLRNPKHLWWTNTTYKIDGVINHCRFDRLSTTLKEELAKN